MSLTVEAVCENGVLTIRRALASQSAAAPCESAAAPGRGSRTTQAAARWEDQIDSSRIFRSSQPLTPHFVIGFAAVLLVRYLNAPSLPANTEQSAASERSAPWTKR